MHYTRNMLKVVVLSGIIFFAASHAGAHQLWINVEKYTPASAGPVLLNVGWGHSFANPVGNILSDWDRLAEVVMFDPKGVRLAIVPTNSIDFKTENALKSEGTYLLSVKRKEGFRSQTTEGYKAQSKVGLANVLDCTFSGGYAKAVVQLGKGGGDFFSKPLGHALEIIPLKDPALIRQGDLLPIKVLYRGEPLRAEVRSTYAGFARDAWAYVSGTNKEGITQIKILQSGIWLLKVNHKVPYHDPAACDQSSFAATLTFEVK